jgi:hypothetical protein
MNGGKIIEIYNQGISQIIETIKLLSNQIKEQSAKIEQFTKENKVHTLNILTLFIFRFDFLYTFLYYIIKFLRFINI